MSVVLETTIGDLTIDLFTEERPHSCKNFLKLCKIKYYNFCLFHHIQANFVAQTGDPTGSGNGGESIYGIISGKDARYYEGEKKPKIKHDRPGLVSMVHCGNNLVGSQFFITLGEDTTCSLDEHFVFGEVTEGHDILLKLNETICDVSHRPYQDIRITHTVILEDPYSDPHDLIIPISSPKPPLEVLQSDRIGADEDITESVDEAELQEKREEKEAQARATILEIVGDLPSADIAPPENVLFVCKLNPVTSDDDLQIIFSRFGKIVSCEVIRDKKSGNSLQYAFVEFDNQKSCEDAYLKMDNVLIDDRRIHVDFSQSVSKIKWFGKGRIKYMDKDDEGKNISEKYSKSKKNGKDNSSKYVSNREKKFDRLTERPHKDQRYKQMESNKNKRALRHDSHQNSERKYYKEDEIKSKYNDEKVRKSDRDEIYKKSDRKNGEDKERRSGEDKNKRSGEDKNRRSGEDKDRRSGEDKNRRCGEDKDRRYGEDKDRRYGDNKDRKSIKEEKDRRNNKEKWNERDEKDSRSKNERDTKSKNEKETNSKNDRDTKYRSEKYDTKDQHNKNYDKSKISYISQSNDKYSKSVENLKHKSLETENGLNRQKIKKEETTISSKIGQKISDNEMSKKNIAKSDEKKLSKNVLKKKKKRSCSSSTASSSSSSSSESSSSSSSSSSSTSSSSSSCGTKVVKYYDKKGNLIKVVKNRDSSSNSDHKKRHKKKIVKVYKNVKRKKRSSSNSTNSSNSDSEEDKKKRKKQGSKRNKKLKI
ncbi:peptidyl-prolyl cis-trans isomerase sig-7 [Daktulosphaira vitifoliae]|uniref:peptidyl-prolyl cis-trans isomerase sig-7 n=1 Tax=Daktulosphaira vitifoliae TaxID=58002 RepID=UPI0021AA4006|nr:peptidyl-prolyl cis-trans isomerase sig-7 [Daktulosphaira vitifoliae]